MECEKHVVNFLHYGYRMEDRGQTLEKGIDTHDSHIIRHQTNKRNVTSSAEKPWSWNQTVPGMHLPWVTDQMTC
jgi:hypothetical protein